MSRVSSFLAFAAGVALAALAATGASAQNLRLAAQLDLAPADTLLGDVWGFEDLALVARHEVGAGSGDGGGLHVVDLCDPARPQLIRTVDLPDAEVEDVVATRYSATRRVAFVAVQDDPAAGWYAIELDDPAAPPVAQNVPAGVHTLFLHREGGELYLFAVSNTSDRVQVLNVTDPDAPFTVLTWFPTHEGQQVGNNRPHEIYPYHDPLDGNRLKMAVANLTDGVYIVELDLVAGTSVTEKHWWYPEDRNGDGDDDDPVDRQFTHSVQVSPDGLFLFTTDESSRLGYLRVWRLAAIPDGYSDDAVPVAQFDQAGPAPGSVAHNMWQNGELLYITWYGEGLVVLDVSNPMAPVRVGHRDTTTINELQRGAWGVHAGGKAILVSDMNEGLFVFSYDGQQHVDQQPLPLARPLKLYPRSTLITRSVCEDFVVVAWIDDRDYPRTGGATGNVLARLYSEDGVALSDEIRINETLDTVVGSPPAVHVASHLGSSRMLVAWSAYAGGPTFELRYRHLAVVPGVDPGTYTLQMLGSEAVLDRQPPGAIGSLRPSATGSDGGNFVAYTTQQASSDPTQVVVRRLWNGRMGMPIRIAQGTSPDVLRLGFYGFIDNEVILVTWAEENGLGGRDIKAQVLVYYIDDDWPFRFGPVMQINRTPGWCGFPSVAGSGSTSAPFVVQWSCDMDPGTLPTQQRWEVFARALRIDGNFAENTALSCSFDQPVSEVTTGMLHDLTERPTLAPSTWVGVWTDQNPLGSAWARRMSMNGNCLAFGPELEIDQEPRLVYHPSVLGIGSRKGVAFGYSRTATGSLNDLSAIFQRFCLDAPVPSADPTAPLPYCGL